MKIFGRNDRRKSAYNTPSAQKKYIGQGFFYALVSWQIFLFAVLLEVSGRNRNIITKKRIFLVAGYVFFL
jgi:hypothetical protein